MTSSGTFVVLDRDGTIIADTGYPSRVEDVRVLPGALAGLAALRSLGIPAFGATNQSGVGRGYFPMSNVSAIHAHLDRAILAAGGEIKRWYVCPHTPDDACACRKPKPGLALQAQQDWRLDLSRGVVIGDKASDMAFAKAFGGRGILIATETTGGDARDLAGAVARDLVDAAEIVRRFQTEYRP